MALYLYVCSYIVFDGLASFTGDAGSYLVLAQQWSPWQPGSAAVIATPPLHAYPPGYPALLALTGASHNWWLAHLLNALCLGAALLLYKSMHAKPGLFLVCVLIMIPGTLYTSFGIMSETLALLLLFCCLASSEKLMSSIAGALLLGLLLSATILTRSLMVALLPAIFLYKPGRYSLVAIACALPTMLIWQWFNPLSGLPSYLDDLPFHDVDLWLSVLRININQLPNAWSVYLAGPLSSPGWIIANGLCFACLFFYTCRAAIMKNLAALTALMMLVIVLLWPYPTDYRFIHALVPLMLTQGLTASRGMRMLIFGSIFTAAAVAQAEIFERRLSAEFGQAHQLEYYLLKDRQEAVERANTYRSIEQFLSASAQVIPENSRVATVKPTLYALISERAAVALTSDHTRFESLCQLKSDNVTHLLISPLTSGYNELGLGQTQPLKSLLPESVIITGADQISIHIYPLGQLDNCSQS